MNIEIYHAEMKDIPWLLEQMKAASEIYSRKKPLYPGDIYARDFTEKMIEKQVVFMAKGLKEGFAYNVEHDTVAKIESYDEIEGGTVKANLTTDFKEDPWIRTGFIAGFLWPHAYNPDISVLSCLFWWCPEEFRGGRSGLKLLNSFVEFGEDHADEIIFGIETESTVNTRILTRKGFRVKETAFIMEV